MADRIPVLDAEVWAAHAGFVRRLARSLVGSSDVADDVEQEAWLVLRRQPPRDPMTLRAWLARVVQNLVRMDRRLGERRDLRERAAASPESQPAAAEVVAQIDLHRRVVEQVLRLAEPYRTVIALRFHEQRSLAEIARELDLPLETVKTRQKRALQQLRAELIGDAKDDGSDARWSALLLLAKGSGGVAMTIGAKWGIASVAAAVGVLLVVRGLSDDSPRRLANSDVDARAATPAVVEAATPEAAAVVRRAEESATAPIATAAPAPLAVPFRGVIATVKGDVVDTQGRPVADARIDLFDRDTRTSTSLPLDGTTTDENGEFELADVPFQRLKSGVVLAWRDGACTGETFDPRSVTPIHLVLAPTKSIVGRVVDSNGTPVEGATLLARNRFFGERGGFLLPTEHHAAATVRSAADGSFTLPNLPAGWKVLLQVGHARFASRRETIQLDETPDDVTTTIVLLPEATIEGNVAFNDGTPSPGIRVGAQIQGSRLRNSWGEAVTNADGHYLIRGLEAGPWNVMVALDEQQEQEWCATSSAGVELTESLPQARVDLVLRRGGGLVVHVRDAANKEPIADEWIGIKSAAKSNTGAAINAIFSDESGRANIRLPPGPVSPYLSRDRQTWLRSSGEPLGSEPFELIDGSTVELIVEIDRGITLRGVVVDPQGQPVANALAWLVGEATMRRDPPQTASRADGSFELSDVPNNQKWHMRAASPGFAMRKAIAIDRATSDISAIRLVLEPRPSTVLRGRVVDSGGQPAANVDVQIHEALARESPRELNSPDTTTHTRTKVDGTFELRGMWPGGRHSILAYRGVESDQGMQLEMANVDVSPLKEEETRELADIVLQPHQ